MNVAPSTIPDALANAIVDPSTMRRGRQRIALQPRATGPFAQRRRLDGATVRRYLRRSYVTTLFGEIGGWAGHTDHYNEASRPSSVVAGFPRGTSGQAAAWGRVRLQGGHNQRLITMLTSLRRSGQPDRGFTDSDADRRARALPSAGSQHRRDRPARAGSPRSSAARLPPPAA